MAVSFGTIPNAIRKVKGGVLRVGDSRVSLDSVIYMFNEGADAVEIQNSYDSLTLAQVHAAIAYYLDNKATIDKYLTEQIKQQKKIRAEIENMFPPDEMRDKILARKKGEDPNWPSE
ncbi:MAG: DUF433 domain-containing protein [Acidobacteria bacterium]|nr:DUF433 domain-containing protein [Acidobacteriota bacterium]